MVENFFVLYDNSIRILIKLVNVTVLYKFFNTKGINVTNMNRLLLDMRSYYLHRFYYKPNGRLTLKQKYNNYFCNKPYYLDNTNSSMSANKYLKLTNQLLEHNLYSFDYNYRLVSYKKYIINEKTSMISEDSFYNKKNMVKNMFYDLFLYLYRVIIVLKKIDPQTKKF